MGVKERAIAAGKRWFDTRNCSICNYPLGYVVLDKLYERLGRISDCWCVNYNHVYEAYWEELESFYNAQTPENQIKLEKLWGIEETKEEEE